MAAFVGRHGATRPIVPVMVHVNGKRRPTYALIDTGANTSAVTESLCKELGAPRKSISVKLNTFDNSSNAQREITSFKITNLSNTFELTVENALIGSQLSTEREKPPTQSELNYFEHLRDLRICELEDKEINLLLDAKFAYYFCTGDNRIGKHDEPLALGTKFGHAIIGPRILNNSEDEDDENDIQANNIMTINAETITLSNMINRMFRQDFICRDFELFPQEMTHRSVEDEQSLKMMQESARFVEEEGRWEITMPWRLGRQPTADLFRTIDFYNMTMMRHSKLERKFRLNPTLKEGSFKQMRMTLEAGHARIIDTLDAPPENVVCYLPNHIVVKPDKPGKFRICQDAASRVGPHFLNKYLFSGPDILNGLIKVILRFRRKRYTISADITNFFYQILLDPRDRSALRYPWWSDETMEKVVMIESLRHMFGVTSSPTISNFILKLHAETHKDKISLDTYLALLYAMYVDDLLESCDDKETARRIKLEITAVLKLGGMDIIKWKCNFPDLDLPSSSTPPFLDSDEENPEVATPVSMESLAEECTNAVPPEVVDGPMEKCGGLPPSCGREEHRASTTASTTPPMEDENVDQHEDEEDDELEAQLTPSELVSILNHDYTESCAKEFLNESDLNDKVLGLGYSFEEDVMNVRVGSKPDREIVTKRDLLSFVASVYDPIGLVSPWLLPGKLLFQEISSNTIPWKSKLNPELKKEVVKWQQSIVHLKKIKISRWTNPLGMEHSICQLVLFCDASRTGYGMCSYLRRFQRGAEDRISVSFLVGKAHVVPTNMMLNPTEGALPHSDSIPRLELCAAKVAAQWRDTLVRDAGENFEDIFIFSDSLTVLGWLNNFTKRFKTFENFRVKCIRSLSPLSEWRHCPTLMNPADLTSKGIRADDTKKWRMYHFGPPFLSLPLSQWPPVRPNPKNEHPEELVADVSALNILAINGSTEEPVVEADNHTFAPWPLTATSKISEWKTKVRRIAIIKRVVLKLRERVRNKKQGVVSTRLRPRKDQKPEKYIIHLSDLEREDAENILVRAIQTVEFEKEILSLAKLGIYSPNSINDMKIKNSKLAKLSPFLDKSNVMRAGGRIAKAEYLPYNQRFPIILPNSSHEIVQSLIRHYHQANYQKFHCTIMQTHLLLRGKYFILGGKNSVRNVLSKCIICQRLSKRKATQKEGNLPAERMAIVPPFYHCALDCLGPFHLRHTGRGTRKQFVLIACCMSTRAITLVPLRDMTTSSIINSLIKIHSQFPALKHLYSDNGTNFKGADREIRESVSAWKKENLSEELDKLELTWTFGPAYCGSYGGSWERLVGLSKKLLRSVIGSKNVDQEDFETLLSGASALMNRRPLTPISADVDDDMALTPSHFLYPYLFTTSANHILPPQAEKNSVLRHGFRCTQHLLDEFWRQFRDSYLQQLLKRSKNSTTTVKEGDVVLVEDVATAREEWPLGRIVRITNSDEHHGRRFSIRLNNGRLVDRAIKSLILLEL